MSVSAEYVQRIGELARLHFEDSELERLTSDLNAILRHVDLLRDLGLEEGSEDLLRGRASLTPGHSGHVQDPDELVTLLVDFAPEWREGFFLVPPPPGVQPSGDR